ncbi:MULTISPECIES: RES family NAD+ phosphorylase [Sphingobacterium]|uniref:RES family NAD+ phosphorylase n=1 Tax=Sphingobacterium TaxID=28453 RepID=UPI0035E3F84C
MVSLFTKTRRRVAKTVRKQDVNLDYLPTQYLCEYIKSLGFHAVEYRSAMKAGDYNLAVFNDADLVCTEVTLSCEMLENMIGKFYIV